MLALRKKILYAAAGSDPNSSVTGVTSSLSRVLMSKIQFSSLVLGRESRNAINLSEGDPDLRE